MKRKLFLTIVVIFSVVMFTRTLFGAGDLSVQSALTRLSTIEFDFDDLNKWYDSVVNFISGDEFSPNFTDDMSIGDKILEALNCWVARPFQLIVQLITNLFTIIRDAIINIFIIFGALADIMGFTNPFLSP